MPPFLHWSHGGFSIFTVICFPSCCVPSRLYLMSHSLSYSVSPLHSPDPLPLSCPCSSFWLTPTFTHTCSPAPVALLLPPPCSSWPHCLPLLFWLIRGLRKTSPWQYSHLGSERTFLLQRICLHSKHTTSQAWVLHIYQYICRLKLEIWNLNYMLGNGAKLLPW